MMPLFLKPIFHEKVWGGSKLQQFGYHLPNEHIGECWGISAHPNGKSEILNGPYAGQTLDQVWNDHRELFGEFPSKDFPLMAKIVDAEAPVVIPAATAIVETSQFDIAPPSLSTSGRTDKVSDSSRCPNFH